MIETFYFKNTEDLETFVARLGEKGAPVLIVENSNKLLFGYGRINGENLEIYQNQYCPPGQKERRKPSQVPLGDIDQAAIVYGLERVVRK